MPKIRLLPSFKNVLSLSLIALLGMGATSDSHQIKNAWKNLAQTPNSCADEFDYFPGGGMRIFYCHAQNLISYRQLQDLIGLPAFKKGPHTRNMLVLNAPNYFGYYNPEFVKALGDTLIPGVEDKKFRILSQPIYEKYMQEKAQIYYVSYKKLQANASYLKQEASIYLKRLEENTLPPYHLEKYFFFMNPAYFEHEDEANYFYKHGFDGGWSGNVVKTAVGFWIRRHIDGTDDAFFANLEKLLQTYDEDFLKTQHLS